MYEDFPKPKLGIEGMTYIPKHDIFLVANEKKPTLISGISEKGEIIFITEPSFSKDISDLAYDEDLDKLWVLSDESQRFVSLIFMFNITKLTFFSFDFLDCISLI